MSRITSGRIMKKAGGKKNVFDKPADLEVALPEIWGYGKKKSSGENIPSSTLQFKVTRKYSKYSVGPVLLLSEDEEHVVKWITDCFQLGYPWRKPVV
jgi:hypothetical protein